MLVLVGGTDSSTGAGLAADLAVARDHGILANTVVTAVTAQTGRRVCAIHLVPCSVVRAQLASALRTHTPRAVKVGLLGGVQAAQVLLDLLPADIPVVVDPVMAASSGESLLQDGLAPVKTLAARATLLTPNWPEAQALSGNRVEAWCAAQPGAVLLKGGHQPGPILTDTLYQGRTATTWQRNRRAGSFRGTGCTLATAIACGLATGDPLVSAIDRAQAYLDERLNAAIRVSDGLFHLHGGPR